MRALVIGGCGFIGSHVVDDLVAHGIETAVLDLRRELYRPAVPGVAYLTATWHDAAAIAGVLAASRYDCVVHLGCTSVPQESNRDPAADAERNLIGSLHVLDACIRTGVPRLVFASTGGAIYGATDRLPIGEGAATEPISSYGIAKLAVEKYLHLYQRNHGLGFAAMRVANPYGPRQNPGRSQGVVAVFARKILAGEAIEIWGDGDQIRDYVYIADVSRAFRLAMASGSSGVFNIGSGRGMSLNELVKALERLTGKTARVTFRAARSVDMAAVVLDHARATAVLGWRPEVGLDDGLRRTLAWLSQSGAVAAATGPGQDGDGDLGAGRASRSYERP
jgi:UDP-glucose 4-epimerase